MDVQTGSEAIAKLLADVAKSDKALRDSIDTGGLDVPESYSLMIECADEEDQRELYERMQQEGRKCRTAKKQKKLTSVEGVDRLIARCDRFNVTRAADVTRRRKAGHNPNIIARSFLVKAREHLVELDRDCAMLKLSEHEHLG